MITDVNIDLVEEILKLKKQKNAVILAHYYQVGEIQDIADFIGDSLQLAQQAQQTNADIILFAGVHFMAETAKILNPSKKVIVPDLNAGCSLADSCPAGKFKEFIDQHPGHIVISYINCSAEVKALTDIICTSSNAMKIVESIPKDQPIIFAPDKNLGRYIIKKTGRQMVLWDGACEVHEKFSLQKIIELKIKHPDALLIAHPECEEDVLENADFIGSTSALLKFVQTDNHQSYIVATETGILHQMQKYCPAKTFIPAPPNNTCACNECPYMKLNTLEKIYLALRDEQPEIIMNPELIEKAKKPLIRMLELSK
ncbi:MAG: quinolinate synthase A [Bacteroidia bacterium]|nr:MAG: quinolinate synthase A [Bacteroidia bacterium]